MFNPSQADVRRFFCEALRRVQGGLPLEGAQALAAPWVLAHSPYHAWLMSEQVAIDSIGHAAADAAFLHLSMHLAITEQCSIDQPAGVRQAVAALAQQRGDEHAAQHAAMECLNDLLRDSAEKGAAPDGAAYVNNLKRLAT